MKLSKREKVLLCILAVLALSYLYYTYMITPLLQKVTEANAVLEQQKQNEALAKIQMASDNKIHTDYKILNANLEMLTQSFFPLFIQEKLLVYLDEMIKASDVSVSSITFSEPTLNSPEGAKEDEKSELDPEIKKILDEISGNKEDDNSENEEVKEDDSLTLEYMSITITVEGRYNNIMNLLNKIEYFNKKILIGSLNLISDGADMLSGTITLDLYAIPKLKVSEDEYFTWRSLFEYGKENPFEPFVGYVPYKADTMGEDSIEDTSQFNKVYDFRAIIKPISSDLPAFIIGDAKEKNNNSYLYADNPNYENVEFNVFKKNDKYYYRYKTDNNSYPKDYENEFAEFDPYNDGIEFSIDSQRRNDNSDVNGINITIINNTDLTLNVDIFNDDSGRSRVNISKLQGNVKINR